MKLKSKILLMMILTLLFSGCSFQKSTPELATGKYVMLDAISEDFAWVLLSEDHRFEFNRNLATSYRPMGTYTVENQQLILKVSDQEIYKFKIVDNRLIFESGKYVDSLVAVGTVFELRKTK